MGMRTWALVVVIGASAACTGAPAADPAADAAALARAQLAAREFGAGLRGRLVAEMGRGGPIAALTVCADEAQAITAQAGESRGVRVGRSSLRLRNPVNSAPPWVDEWLRAQGERPAEGVVGLTAVVDGPDGRVARVIKPVAIEAPCLVCHGAPESIAPALLAVLRERYPDDRANGYAVGELRGALWAEAPVRASR